MKQLLTGSWKTTVIGIATALFAFVAFDPELFSAMPWLIAISKFAMIGGLAGMGIVSKDKAVTGGTVPNPINDASVVATSAKVDKGV